MAKSIIDTAQGKLAAYSLDINRMAAMKQMQQELMQLKETYKGLVDMPKEDLATYSREDSVYLQLK